jgi:hypothetical protein
LRCSAVAQERQRRAQAQPSAERLRRMFGSEEYDIKFSTLIPVHITLRREATKPNVRRRRRFFSDLKVVGTNRTLPNCIGFVMFR